MCQINLIRESRWTDLHKSVGSLRLHCFCFFPLCIENTKLKLCSHFTLVAGHLQVKIVRKDFLQDVDVPRAGKETSSLWTPHPVLLDLPGDTTLVCRSDRRRKLRILGPGNIRFNNSELEEPLLTSPISSLQNEKFDIVHM